MGERTPHNPSLFAVNCWPQENGSGSCDVNIEYTLECEDMELDDVTITIPLASGVPPPVVNECEGEHEFDRLHSTLVWRIPVIDKTCPTAAMDFTARGIPENFFPVRVNFVSKRSYCHLKASGAPFVFASTLRDYLSHLCVREWTSA